MFALIAVGGTIQAWAFYGLPPKPLLYDFLGPFPFWVVWMYLLVPLDVLLRPLKSIGIDVMAGGGLFIAAHVVYFYLLSCLFVTTWDWCKKRRNPLR